MLFYLIFGPHYISHLFLLSPQHEILSRSFVMICPCHYLQSATYMHLFLFHSFLAIGFSFLSAWVTETTGGKRGPIGKYEQFCALKNYWFFIVKKYRRCYSTNCIRDVSPRGLVCKYYVYFSGFPLLDFVICSHIFSVSTVSFLAISQRFLPKDVLMYLFKYWFF